MPPRARPMPRGKPLARTGSLTQAIPLQRSGRISPVSKKRAAQNRERRAMVNRLWPERPRCACGCGCLADDLHEIKSRARGGSIVDPANCVPLARVCHDKATSEDPRMYELRLVVHSWEAVA